MALLRVDTPCNSYHSFTEIFHVVSFHVGFDKTSCREPISSVFRYVLDQNADGVLDESELADIYEISTEPCIKEFFKACAKGKETFSEAEFCSCFSSVGKTFNWFLPS